MALLLKHHSQLLTTFLKFSLRSSRNWNHTLCRQKWKYENLTSGIAVRQKHSVQQPAVQENESSKIPSSRKSFNHAVGDKLHGFTVKEIEHITEFQLTAVRLIHDSTGGEYLHIDRSDSNNAFSVLFRTTPHNSTGLPHILEHLTLCGSRKFPVRDPFFKMMNRSLATFMNALTAPDCTLYPFSTQNEKDYQNLMSVYLDAVFQPKLKRKDFWQEGWRLEHADPQDPKSPIIIKGVVYNEMKGVYADNQIIFEEALMNNILPSNTYGVCSGGHPLEIPNLSHMDLINFHKKYYSPFNAKYYSYGDISFTKHLKYINDVYLDNVKMDAKKKESTEVPQEKRWTQPVRKHIACRFDPLEADNQKNSSIAISTLCCSVTEIEETFLLKVLAELLVRGPNSSFYKPLIESNIGSGFVPSTGYETQPRDTYFTVGLQGVSDKDFDKIIKIYDETIDSVIENGFDKKNIEAVLHSIELNTKHQTSNFGLGLLFSIAPIWNHDGDVIKYLQIENQVKKLRQKIADDPEYLQKKVKEYFKDNQHKLVLTMSPDPNYEQNMKVKEEKILKGILKKLTYEDEQKIYQNGLLLLKEQDENKSCLPTLQISDLKKTVEKVNHYDENIHSVPFRIIPQPTNGIAYFRGLVNTNNLNSELKQFLPLFALIATNMGTKKHNYKEFHQLASLKTGGLNIETHFINDPKNVNGIEETLAFSSYCLNRNIEEMFCLWSELFREIELRDENRFITLVKAEAANLANSVTSHGHHFAMMASSGLVSPTAMLKENNGGLTFVNSMKAIAQSNSSEILPQMIKICESVMSKRNLRCAMNVLDGTEKEILDLSFKLIDNIPGTVESFSTFKDHSDHRVNERGVYHDLPIPVSYSAKTIVTVPYKHEDFARLSVLTRLMTMKYLHPEIREKGGAYGAGLILSSSGLLNFYSYRDPNPLNSLQTYDNAIDWLKKAEFNQEDVDEAKLGIFQHVDSPTPPGDKGMREFLHGITDEMYQNHRLNLMKVTKDELVALADKYFDESVNKNLVGRAVVGPENKAVTDNKDQDWKVVTQT